MLMKLMSVDDVLQKPMRFLKLLKAPYSFSFGGNSSASWHTLGGRSRKIRWCSSTVTCWEQAQTFVE